MPTDYPPTKRRNSHSTALMMMTVGIYSLTAACVGLPAEDPCASNNGSYLLDDNNSQCFPPVDCSVGRQAAEAIPLSAETCTAQISPNCTTRTLAGAKWGPCLDLADGDLRYVYAEGEELQGSSFARSDLTNAIIIGCDLRDADFRSAKLHNTALGCSVLFRADFTNADLTGAFFRCGSADASLRGAIIRNTICPDGTVADDSCDDHVLE